MGEKLKPVWYTVDFVTALPVQDCVTRLERLVFLPPSGLGGTLAPVRQQTMIHDTNAFTVERWYPGAIYPIRLVGHLDRTPEGTHVHGSITHDAANQVLIEGLVVFLTVFLITALLFLRLRARVLVISVPLLLALLTLASIRWRALRAAAEDLTPWLRHKLYVTPQQLK